MKPFTIVIFLFFTCITIGIAQNAKDTILAFQYYQKANSLTFDKKRDSANVYLEKAIPIYKKAKSWKRIAHCYNTISDNLWDLEDFDGAVLQTKKALEICHNHLPALTVEKAIALGKLGEFKEHIKLDYPKALELYTKSLEIKKQILTEDHLLIADSYASLSSVYEKKGEFEKALNNLNLSIDVRIKKFGEDHFEIFPSLRRRALIYNAMKRDDLALFQLEKGVELSKKKFGEDHIETVKFYNIIGSVYFVNKEYSRGFYYMKKVKTKFVSQLDNPLIYYNNMGIVCLFLERYDEALGYYKKVLSNLGENKIFFFVAKYNIALINVNIGKPDIALKSLEKLIFMGEQRFGKDYFELTRCYLVLSEIYSEKGFFDKSFNLLNKTLRICTKVLGEKSVRVGIINQRLGDLFAKQHKYDEALLYYNKALVIAENLKIESNSNVSNIHYKIGKTYFQKKELEEALFHFENAEQIDSKFLKNAVGDNNESAQNLNAFFRLRLLNYTGRTFYDLYSESSELIFLKNCLTSYQEANDLISIIRQDLNKYNDKLNFSKTAKSLYEGVIKAQLSLFELEKNYQNLHQAFRFSEKSKSNTLKEFLNISETKKTTELSPELSQLEYDLKIERAYYRSKLSEVHFNKSADSSKLISYESKLFDISRKQDSLKEVLEKNYPKYHKLKYQDSVISVQEIQEKLDEKTTLLEFFTTDSITYAFTISKNKMSVKELVVERLSEKIEDIKTLIIKKDVRTYKKQAYQLYKELIAPIKDELVGNELVIIPDGPLWHLNFDLLLSEQNATNNPTMLSYLLKEYVITYANSATLLFSKDLNAIDAFTKKGECLAFSFSDSTLTTDTRTIPLASLRKSNIDLPGTRKEIKAIADIVDGAYYYGSEAVERNFKKEAKQYNILHLALHGEVDNEHPENSKLYFTKNKDTIEDNVLYSHELFALNIPAELTVLSACNTGSGKIAKGEGIMSLGNAFQYAGTKSLLLSSWEVSDQTTPELMKYFYKNLKKGMHKGEALQQAKIQYLNNADINRTHPFYWGGFYLVGDVSPVEFRDANSSIYWILGCAVLLIFLLIFVWYKKKTRVL
ncbi:CHAT domain-containing protein [Aquimarina pacifica]|uniref:CHAT domain-containing protein n=1 Tax=Aquimarina pacifica TaxID=1296415 RepID=UPI000472DBAC|nr:CHAT domain-containing tetratricopeptide repeat protein [Aquimarina pacifica]